MVIRAARTYTAEERRGAVEEAIQLGPAAASRKLGIPAGTLSCWVFLSKQRAARGGEAAGASQPAAEASQPVASEPEPAVAGVAARAGDVVRAGRAIRGETGTQTRLTESQACAKQLRFSPTLQSTGSWWAQRPASQRSPARHIAPGAAPVNMGSGQSKSSTHARAASVTTPRSAGGAASGAVP